jgi:Lon protease-like protein
MSDDIPALDNFGGVARLFPLPNLVMFPSVIQPLHIFEPRYRQITADALAGDRLLAVVLLQPGFEDDYEGRPAVHPVACLGRIVADQRLEDGRYNLLLRGLKRVRILEEVSTGKLYRSARVEVLEDVGEVGPEEEADFRRRLGEVVPRWFPEQDHAQEQFRRLLDGGLSAGTLCDVFAFALPLDTAFKQGLLEELRVGRRAEALLAHLEAHAPGGGVARRFPPDFSSN